jgi:ATP-dependent RNA helicase DDX24/MAK5
MLLYNCGNCARFSADPQGFLIATDVAARGLDIPNIEHVVHYQVKAQSNNLNHYFNLDLSVFV